MRSARPKALHQVAGRLLLGHVLAALEPLAPGRTVVVVGHRAEDVVGYLAAAHPEATPVVQHSQDGTGHAVRVALDAVPGLDGPVLVLYADLPLLTTGTLRRLVESGPATLLAARLPDPAGYGRVLRDPEGRAGGVVEDRDATGEQRRIDEVNAGAYVFDATVLRAALGKLEPANAQGELYLTDVVAMAPTRVVVADAAEIQGVNDRAQLAVVGAALRDRTLAAAMRAGVTIVDPATTWVDVTVTLDPDATIEPFTILRGATVVRRDAVVGPHCDLTDTTVGEGAQVRASTCAGAEIGDGARVGPYAYLRPGTTLAAGAKAGAFVEVKNAEIGEGSKVPHLAYVGDATIGRNSNIGAGTIVVNYDGQEKHRTTVGDDVRIGSDNCLVAPVTVGDTAYTAAGSVITQDVPPGALGVGRARQRNIDGWVARKRPEGDRQ